MSKRKNLFRFLVLLFLISLPYRTWAWSGKVVAIADGDTITVLRDREQARIRLYGIDTPEKGQAFGKKAKQFTSDMVFGKVVEVEPVDIDRYGRTVALVTVLQRLVNEALVHAGCAGVYTRYCDRPTCARGGRCWNMKPGKLNEGFGLILTPYRLGNIEKRSRASDPAVFFLK